LLQGKIKIFQIMLPGVLGLVEGAAMSTMMTVSACFTHQLTAFVIRAVRSGGCILLQEISFVNNLASHLEAGCPDSGIALIGTQIGEFLSGIDVDFSEWALDLSTYTVFQQRVLNAARKIPRGTTISYAELAKMAGYPGSFRAAASVMRKNRFPLVIPCHRVIKGSGEAGGYCGETEGRMAELKMRLIEMERVR
jgi:methylated-DNA-[protein]-cysteine S-methyltransferase